MQRSFIARPVAAGSFLRVCRLVAGWGLLACAGAESVTKPTIETPVTPTPRPIAVVALSQETAALVRGATVAIVATPRDAGNAPVDAVVTWSTSDASRAIVSQAGLVTAVAPGTATITATSGAQSGVVRVVVQDGGVVTQAGGVILANGGLATITVAAGTVTQSVAISVDPATQAVTVPQLSALPGAAYRIQAQGVLSRPLQLAIGYDPAALRAGVTPDQLRLYQLLESGGVIERSSIVSTAGRTVTGMIEGSGTYLLLLPAAVAGVELSTTALSLPEGSTATLSATLRDAGGATLTDRPVTWSSSDPTVATVGFSSGVVTTLRTGRTTITASSEGQSATTQVTVTAPVVSNVSVGLGTSALTVGGATQATVIATDVAGRAITDRAVNWYSSNSSVASVDGRGTVTATGAGSATISATVDGVTGSAVVQVVAVAVGSVSVALDADQREVGQTARATATVRSASGQTLQRAVTWSSDNVAVARVDASGVVTAVARGTATIRATSDGVTGSAAFTVGPPRLLELVFSQDGNSNATYTTLTGSTTGTFNLLHGLIGSTYLQGYKAGSNGIPYAAVNMADYAVTYSSSDPSVVTISSTGVLSALSVGSATITATADGRTATASVVVSGVRISLSQVPLNCPAHSTSYPPQMRVGETCNANATVRYISSTFGAPTGYTVTRTGSNPAVATVTAAGAVTGVAPGSLTVTFSATGGNGVVVATETMPVTVVP